MDIIKVRHQAFLGSFAFCGLAELDLTLAALNRAFPLLSESDRQAVFKDDNAKEIYRQLVVNHYGLHSTNPPSHA
jgi:hypothetical protein